MTNGSGELERFIWREYFATLHALTDAEDAVRAGDQPEAVHALRVACRRLRSNLRSLRPLLDREWAGATRAALDVLDQAAIPVRDTQVMLERISAIGAELDVETDPMAIGALRLRLLADERRQLEALRSHLDSGAHFELMQRLAGAADAHVVRIDDDLPFKKTLRGVNREAWREFVKAARAADPNADAAQLHRLRILAKRMRYLAQASESDLGPRTKQRAKLARRAQNILGRIQDSIVLCAWLEATADAEPELRGSIETLLYAEDLRRQTLRSRWRELRRDILR